MKKVELLAPAGDLERLKWAIHYGADAVYLGGSLYGLRANANNFSEEELREGVAYAHARQKKVYVTINIAFHNQELQELIPYLKYLEEIQVDAIIISDPAVLSLARKHTNLVIHLSTQQSTLNSEACAYFKEQGVQRIVLGREVSKEDIQAIQEKVKIELETFIHGAMCASYSGRCVLSNFLTKRDSNRGGCSQICRWDFQLYDPDFNQLCAEKPFTFCAKDLSTLCMLKELIEQGITSFKIEGRMRSLYYVATVTSIYRKAIDSYYQNQGEVIYTKEDEWDLERVANREAIVQFLNGNSGKDCQYYNGRVEVSNQDFLGIILHYDHKTSLATVEQRNYFEKGQNVQIFGPNHETYTFIVEEIYDQDSPIDVVRHPRQIVQLRVPFPVFEMDILRKKIVDKRNEK